MWSEPASLLLALTVSVIFILHVRVRTQENRKFSPHLQWNILFHTGNVPIYAIESEKFEYLHSVSYRLRDQRRSFLTMMDSVQQFEVVNCSLRNPIMHFHKSRFLFQQRIFFLSLCLRFLLLLLLQDYLV